MSSQLGLLTVICGSEQVTACICVKSFDAAEQKGLQVSQAACHGDDEVIQSLPLKYHYVQMSFHLGLKTKKCCIFNRTAQLTASCS